MSARPSSPAYAEATPVLIPAAEARQRVPRRAGNGTIVGRGLTILGESVLVALAVPFIILGLGLPVVLVVRLMLEIVRALR